MEYSLYKWQEECIEAWMKNHNKGIVNVITGAGKTVFALEAARRLDEMLNGRLRIKIVVPVLPLVKGWSASVNNQYPLQLIGNRKAGIYTGERKDSLDHKIMIYTINTARYTLARHIDQDLRQGAPVLLIADECHHYSSPENRKIFDFMKRSDYDGKNFFSIGLSATPHAAAEYETVLIPSLGKEIYRYTFSDGLAAKTVSDFFIYQIAVSFTAAELAEYDLLTQTLTLLRNKLYKQYPKLKTLSHEEFFKVLHKIAESEGEDSPAQAYILTSYQRQRLTGDASSRIHCTVDLISSLHRTERILIFCEKIEQSEKLYHQLRQNYPNHIGLYHSELPSDVRKNTLENFKNGIFRIIVSCKALDEGLDVPDATVGIVLSSTSVDRQRIQRLGRILRKNPAKACACLYYLYVKESSEDAAYLPDQLPATIISNLSYTSSDRHFRYSEYEKAAAELLDHYHKNRATASEEAELRSCLMEGLVRYDWRLPNQYITEQITNNEKRHTRNYWYVMKMLKTRMNI